MRPPKLAEGTCKALRCIQGVQQGIYVSRLLFMLLLASLHMVLEAMPGKCGPAMTHVDVGFSRQHLEATQATPLRLFADALAMPSTRPEHLQRMRMLQEFSKKRRLMMHLGKAKVHMLVSELRCTLAGHHVQWEGFNRNKNLKVPGAAVARIREKLPPCYDESC